ncbi:MAG TPA: tetratricopeptide repeat protein, partial [Chloroflexota bacterium]|nr:tetratricopeptide repeat protein [Chloroflexota bacterium]
TDGAPGELVHLELAQALSASGDLDGAAREWQLAEAAPYLVRQAKQEPAEAEALLRLATRVDPEEATAYQALADVYLADARVEEARTVLEERRGLGPAVDPGRAVSELELGLMAYHLDGNLDQALRYLGAAVRDDPADESLKRAIADVLDAAGQGPAAEHWRREADVALQSVQQPRDTLGHAYEALGLWHEASAEYTRVANGPASDPVGDYDLGELSLGEGQPSKALVQLRAAARLIPNQETFRLALAQVYLELGQAQRARDQYQLIVSNDPGNLEARRALTCPEGCRA